jgi:thymidylate synthase (FAD)
MKIIKPSVEILTPLDGAAILQHIERCGRVCYKSEDKITSDSAEPFVRGLIKRGHESVLEHYSFTVKFVCDRGVSHEIVRHRLASYSQESTRYCNYAAGKFDREITVILPCFFDTGMGNMSNSFVYAEWKTACERAERSYFKLLDMGATPQEARTVLPNSLKTEVVMTANLREWRHFLRLRTSPAAHPQMREAALMLLEQVREKVPVVFEDIEA